MTKRLWYRGGPAAMLPDPVVWRAPTRTGMLEFEKVWSWLVTEVALE